MYNVSCADPEYSTAIGGAGSEKNVFFARGIPGLFSITLLCGLNKFEFSTGVWTPRPPSIFARPFPRFLKTDNEVFIKLAERSINYHLSVNLPLKIFNNYVF